jgi:hypothetical protein
MLSVLIFLPFECAPLQGISFFPASLSLKVAQVLQEVFCMWFVSSPACRTLSLAASDSHSWRFGWVHILLQLHFEKSTNSMTRTRLTVWRQRRPFFYEPHSELGGFVNHWSERPGLFCLYRMETKSSLLLNAQELILKSTTPAQ